jgi:hypothetical protein
MWMEEKIILNEHEFAILFSDPTTKLVHKIDVYQAEIYRPNNYQLKSTYQNIHGITREDAIKRIM